MKYGSVCSGIEAASVAWESLGWQAQWYSEIEHFPSAVLAHRFPTVPNLGDMTQIHNTEHFNGTTINLLVGGTPCQSFSVAGLRKGLDDPRGQLMYTFVELAARKRPRWVVWENVPGVLSSNKGGDFASFLGLLTGRDIQAPVGGWTNSGCIEGISSAYGVAWTMLDAQDFGVAQRRKRIFVIGYLGDWRPPAAVLFERNRLQGDTTKSREKRKATSADAQGGVGGGGKSGIATYAGNVESDVAATLQTSCDDYSRADGFNVVAQTFSVPAIGNIIEDSVSSCITKNSGGGGETQNPAFILEPKAHAFKVRGGSETETGEQGGTPGKKAGKGYLGQDEKAFTIGTTQDQQIAQPIVYENHPADSRVKEMGETCQTVSARFGTGGGNVPLVQQPVAAFIPKNGAKASGIGYAEEQSPTLDTGCSSLGVVQPVAVDCYNQTINHKTTQTIGSSASDVNHYGAVLQPVPYRKTKRAQSKDDHETWVEDDKANTINTFDVGDVRTTQAIVQAHPVAVDFRNQNISEDVTGTIQSKSNGGYSLNYQPGILQPNIAPTLTASNDPSRSPQSSEVTNQIKAVHQATMAIRRLLPVECEKLQGFPPKWTEIPYRGKPADQCPDGPRYKACGNSMAVPCMAWLGQRIQMVDDILNEQNNGAAAIPQL